MSKFKVGDRVRVICFKDIYGKEEYIDKIYKIQDVLTCSCEEEQLYVLKNEPKYNWLEGELELVEEKNGMKINDVLKDENIGRAFKLNGNGIKWHVVKKKLSGELDLYRDVNGAKSFIGEYMHLSEILNGAFVEVNEYKKIDIKEAMNKFLDGETLYRKATSKEKYVGYILTGGKFMLYDGSESILNFKDVLREQWYGNDSNN